MSRSWTLDGDGPYRGGCIYEEAMTLIPRIPN
jgi:hypothetical protein